MQDHDGRKVNGLKLTHNMEKLDMVRLSLAQLQCDMPHSAIPSHMNHPKKCKKEVISSVN